MQNYNLMPIATRDITTYQAWLHRIFGDTYRSIHGTDLFMLGSDAWEFKLSQVDKTSPLRYSLLVDNVASFIARLRKIGLGNEVITYQQPEIGNPYALLKDPAENTWHVTQVGTKTSRGCC